MVAHSLARFARNNGILWRICIGWKMSLHLL